MTEHSNGISLSFRDTLARRADEKAREIDRLARQQIDITNKIAAAREYVTALNRLLAAEGLPEIEIPESRSRRQSVTTPARQERYADMKLADAVEVILEEAGELHADDIVRRIFEVKTPEDLAGGKQNVVSTLTRKAGVRAWERVEGKPNTFRAKQKEFAMS
jgi:hypothetical protein